MDNFFIFKKDKNSIQYLEDIIYENTSLVRLYKNSILGRIISQNSVCYPTKNKKVIRKLDRIFIFEKIKKLSIAHGQG